MVPNMTLVETQNAGNAFVVVRGISQARNSEPSVAVLVDGVLETNPAQLSQELFDIKQIEVLKGPHGRALRPQCHRRRHHHPQRRSRGRARRQGEARLRQRLEQARAGKLQRSDHRHAELRAAGELLRRRWLYRQRVSGWQGGPCRGSRRSRAPDVETERGLHRRPARVGLAPGKRRHCTSSSRARTRPTRSARSPRRRMRTTSPRRFA